MPRNNLLRGNVLIAEDEPILAYSVSEVLQELGATTTSIVVSNTTALEALSQKKFTFVFLDMNLIDGSSSRVAERLIREKVCFLIASGYQDPEFALTLNDVELLSKPFSRSELISSVERAISS